MKKLILFSLIIFFTTNFTNIGLSESPGSWRDKESFGLGFGLEGIGGGTFFDYAINSTFQMHFFWSTKNQSQKSLFAVNNLVLSYHIETNTSVSGLSLRVFPSDSSGFFLGLGGGIIAINQTVDQSIYCYSSFFSTLNPPECSGYEGSTLKHQTISEGSGSVGFGEIGWQGYEGYYFTVGLRGGSVFIESETDNTEKVIDYSDDKITAKKQWKDAKTSSGAIISFGWHF